MRRLSLRLAGVVALLALGAACTGGAIVRPPAETVNIDVWFHLQAGAERSLFDQQVAAFNLAQEEVVARPRVLAEGAYNEQVLEALGTEEFPDVVSVGGDLFYDLVGRGALVDLNLEISGDVRADLLPWVFGEVSFAGGLFGLPAAAIAIVVLFNPERAEVAETAIPSGVPTVSAFSTYLDAIERSAPGEPVLDLRLALERTEFPDWAALAFQPLFESAGGGLLKASSPEAQFLLDGPESVEAARALQAWARAGYLDEAAPAAFARGRVAVMWADTTTAALLRSEGVSVVVRPVPSFGVASSTGIASFPWAASATSEHRDAAVSFIEYMVSPERSAELARATLGYPASATALAGGDWWTDALAPLADDIAAGNVATRHPIPAWGELSEVFAESIESLIEGGEAFATLNEASEAIDALIRSTS